MSPLYAPPVAAQNVTIDANGFIHIGNSIPFKYETELLPDGSVRISHIILDDQGQEKTIASAIY